MTDADYRAWVEVLPEFQRFNQAVESGVVGGLAGAGASGSNAMGGALVAGIGKFAVPLVLAIGALGIASAIVGAIQTGVDAGVQYLSQAVRGAADLQQSVGAVEAVFKDSGDQILAWGEIAADAVGLSKNSYFEFATVVGAQLKNLGTPMEDVAERTNTLIGLGADLSAQFGGSTSEAVAALSSLLRGERDPIERYGVSIKQADVNARVAAMGLGELTLEEQRQAEIMATLSILTEQTADAQGTFAREQDTYLGVQQRLNAELETTAAEFGEQLLPILQEVMVFVREELLPMWVDLNEQVGPELKAALEETWPILKQLAEQVLPLIPPAIEMVVGALDWLGETVRVFTTYLNFLTGTFSDFFSLLAGDMSINQFVANFQARLNEWLSALQERLASAVGFFQDMGVGIATTIAKIGANLYNSGRAIIQQFIDGIRSMLGAVGNAIGGVMDWVAGFFPNSPAKRGAFAGQGWVQIAAAGGAIMDQLQSGFRPVNVPLSYTLPDPAAANRAPLGTERDDGVFTSSGTATLVKLDGETMQEIAALVVDRLPSAIAREGRLGRRMGDYS